MIKMTLLGPIHFSSTASSSSFRKNPLLSSMTISLTLLWNRSFSLRDIKRINLPEDKIQKYPAIEKNRLFNYRKKKGAEDNLNHNIDRHDLNINIFNQKEIINTTTTTTTTTTKNRLSEEKISTSSCDKKDLETGRNGSDDRKKILEGGRGKGRIGGIKSNSKVSGGNHQMSPKRFIDLLIQSQASVKLNFEKYLMNHPNYKTTPSNIPTTRIDNQVSASNAESKDKNENEKENLSDIQNRNQVEGSAIKNEEADSNHKNQSDSLSNTCLSPAETLPMSVSSYSYQYGITEKELSDISDPVKKILSMDLASKKEIHSNQKRLIRSIFSSHERDCGSVEVQIALLSLEIVHMVNHLIDHRKDFPCQRKLIQSIQRRKKLLKYLKRISLERYFDMISQLNIRHTELV